MSVTIKALEDSDETTTFDHGSVQVVRVGGVVIRSSTFAPGWRWSTSVKPIAKTDSCNVHHVGYLVSGTLGVASDDGKDAEIHAGEAYEILPGHDGWVVGDEAVRSVEFTAAEA
jgi:hypothetical protein